MHRSLFAPGGVACSILPYRLSQKCMELWPSEYLSFCQWLLSILVLIEHSLDALQHLCPDFTSIVLVRKLLGSLNRLVLPATLPFYFVSWWLFTTTTSDLETGNTIPELSIPPIPTNTDTYSIDTWFLASSIFAWYIDTIPNNTSSSLPLLKENGKVPPNNALALSSPCCYLVLPKCASWSFKLA